jgi:hypothetical protein
MIRPRAVALMFVPALALAWCSPALAQSDRELATRRDLIAQAGVLSDQGNHAEALALAKRAAAIKMTPSLRLFLAGEQSKLQLVAEAYGNSRQCSVEAEADTHLNSRERILAACKELEESLGKHVGRLTVTVSGAPGASVKVSVGGEEISSALLGEPYVVSPGKLTVAATAAGFLPFSTEIEVPDGGSAKVEVELQPDPSTQPCATGQERVGGVCVVVVPVVAAPIETAPPPPVIVAPTHRSSTRRTWSLALGGAGVVGLGLGSALGLAAISAKSAAKGECPSGTGCPAQAVHDERTTLALANASTVAFVAGGVLLAGGLALYLTAPRDPSLRIGIRVGPGTAGVMGAF